MKIVLQRVKQASVSISNEVYSSIGKGYLILIGIEKGDTKEIIEKYADKIIKLRIFPDENDKMNLSINDVNGSILVVSQFTLAGNCEKGTRPSFDNSAQPDEANKLYEYFTGLLRASVKEVKTGVFGAMMEVSLINDGPVTFILG